MTLKKEKLLLGDKPVTQQQYLYSRVLVFVYQAAIYPYMTANLVD